MQLARTALFALALTLPAAAQDLQFGAHGGLNIPLGDLSDATDGRIGATIGGHLGVYYGDGHEFRPRVDFTHYAGGWHPTDGVFDKNTIDSWGVAADYIFYTDGRPQGLYITLGLGYQWWTVSPDSGASSSESGLAFAGGAGWRFNRTFALEGRFTTSQFRANNGQGAAFQILATVRF